MEWGLPPWEINRQCTEEMLAVLFRARARRLLRLHAAADGKSDYRPPARQVSDNELFTRSQSLKVQGVPVQGLSGIRPRVVARKPN